MIGLEDGKEGLSVRVLQKYKYSEKSSKKNMRTGLAFVWRR